MLTNPNNLLELKSQRDSGFSMSNRAQSRLEVTNRYFVDNRNVPFYLEGIMEKKICIKCKKLQPLTEFNRRNSYNNKQYYQALCYECSKPLQALKWKRYKNRYRNRISRYYKKYYESNKNKQTAKSKARWAIKIGKLKPQLCEICKQKAEMHHDNYNQPLRVLWLCRKHHIRLHKQCPR
jgi:hypothetical protein